MKLKRIALKLKWLLTTGAGVKSILVNGSYVFTILAGLVAVWAFVFPNSFGEAIKSLTETNQELLESSRGIEENTAGAKREVSSDPIIQLSNRGYMFQKDDFARAISNHDLASVSLFCVAAPQNWVSDTYFPFGLDWTPKMLRTLDDCPAVDKDAMCQVDSSKARFSMMVREGEDRDRFLLFCGPNASRDIERASRDAKVIAERAEAERKAAELENLRVSCNETVDRELREIENLKRHSFSATEIQERVAQSFAHWESSTRPNSLHYCFSNNSCRNWLSKQNADKIPRVRQCSELGIDLYDILVRQQR